MLNYLFNRAKQDIESNYCVLSTGCTDIVVQPHYSFVARGGADCNAMEYLSSYTEYPHSKYRTALVYRSKLRFVFAYYRKRLFGLSFKHIGLISDHPEVLI